MPRCLTRLATDLYPSSCFHHHFRSGYVPDEFLAVRTAKQVSLSATLDTNDFNFYGRTLCCLVADTMLALDAHRSTQLECVTALTLLISRQDDGQALLSIHQVRDIVRVMRSKLTDCPFVVQVLGLVVNSLVRDSFTA
jgi:hypothetical protein